MVHMQTGGLDSTAFYWIIAVFLSNLNFQYWFHDEEWQETQSLRETVMHIGVNTTYALYPSAHH